MKTCLASCFVARQIHPVQAQVTRAALEQRGAHRQAKDVDQPRQIPAEQLVLQRLGGGGQQDPFAAQERGHEIRKGLPDAGARLDDQHAALGDGLGNT